MTSIPVASNSPTKINAKNRLLPEDGGATKIFIIGLPRTGTTSVSVALLEQGYRVAHQAFTKHSFELADVISDAPCFSDYRQLDKLFPGAKFVYLDRALDTWVPSMQMLLSRMLVHLDDKSGRFNAIMKRSFNCSFGVNRVDDVMDSEHLIKCYLAHKEQVLDYFRDRDDLLSIDISEPGSLAELLNFLECDPDTCDSDISHLNFPHLSFPHLNKGRNVASWDEYKHPNKISANAAGPENRKYFSYKLPNS
ncbi:sulfotransferase family protein [Shewanella atlantica]|uniref:sulfotransferase family protein n=1 Tax=Shewanella atlantica TaxID=271099 RepID=UPI003734CF84